MTNPKKNKEKTQYHWPPKILLLSSIHGSTLFLLLSPPSLFSLSPFLFFFKNTSLSSKTTPLEAWNPLSPPLLLYQP